MAGGAQEFFTWRRGEQGPRGPAGAPKVIEGSKGDKGDRGPQGATTIVSGSQGPQGYRGPAGNTAVGPPGPQGIRGPQGLDGPQGPPGPAGGPQGEVGPPGPVGPQGAVGPVGPVGPQGLKGDPGTSAQYIVSLISGSAEILSADFGKLLLYTGSGTITLPAPSLVDEGFYIRIRNISTVYNSLATLSCPGYGFDNGLTQFLRRGEEIELFPQGVVWKSRFSSIGFSANISEATSNWQPIASGADSIAAGKNSKASGTAAVSISYRSSDLYGVTGNYGIGIGTNVSVSGTYNVGLGHYAATSGSYAMSLGANAIASNTASYAIGRDAVSAAPNAYAFGYNASANNLNSYALGNNSYTYRNGQFTYANGYYTSRGDSQYSVTILRATTVGASSSYLRTDTNAVNSLNVISLRAYSTVMAEFFIVARSDDGASALWLIKVAALRSDAVGTTSLIGNPVVETLKQDAGLSSATIAIAADTVNGAFAILGTGATGATIRWMATAHTYEVLHE